MKFFIVEQMDGTNDTVRAKDEETLKVTLETNGIETKSIRKGWLDHQRVYDLPEYVEYVKEER